MLQLTVKVQSVHKKVSIPVAIISKQRYQWLRYSGKVPDHGVAISYLGFPELTEKNILLFNGGPFANSDAYLGMSSRVSVVLHGFQREFETRIADFYLTDIQNDINKSDGRPLWFYHLMVENDKSKVELTEEFSGLHILDKNMQDVPTDRWMKVQEIDTLGSGTIWKIYHDLEPYINFETGEYEVYYIQYKSQTGEEIFQLLDSKRVYRRLDDINSFLDPNQKTYQISVSSHNTYSVRTEYFNITGSGLWFKPALTGQIRAIKPVAVNNALSWQVRFTNGGFFNTVNNKVYRYGLPEFYRQSFFQNRVSERLKEVPVMEGGNEGQVIERRLIKSKYAPMIIDPVRDMYLEVIVMDKNGKAYDGYTNNPYKLYWQNPERTNTIVLRDFTHFNEFSYNTETGFIRLPYDIKEDDRVFINHMYREDYLNYDELEFNPVFNHMILDRKVLFYLRPQATVDSLFYYRDDLTDRGLYHLVVDWNGQLIDYPKDDDGTPSDPEFKANPVENLVDFQTAFPEKLFITTSYVGRLMDPHEVVDIDVRLPGGGLKESVDVDGLIDLYPELLWIADNGNWEGRPYPGTSALLVELPEELRIGNGGEFTDEELRGIVKKHMAFGTYPIIRFYGQAPVIKEVWGKDGKVYLSWIGVRTAQHYHIYQVFANNEADVLIGETEEDYANGLDLQQSISGIYRVKVVAVHDEEEGLGSNVVMFKVA